MKISDIDKASQLWSDLSEYLTSRLQALRQQNDSRLTETETAALRGRIAEIKDMLRLGEDRPT